MLNAIRTAALSALVGLGALVALPAAAHADGIYLNFGHGDPRFGIHAGDRHHARDWRRDHRRLDRRKDRACTAGRALDKAHRMGLRHARVIDTGRHTIKVRGLKYNGRVTVVFGRDRGCSVVYR